MAELEWRLGEVLVEQGSITMEHLRFATDQEAKTGESRWKILVRGGVLSEQDLMRAKSVVGGGASGAPAAPAAVGAPASVGASVGGSSVAVAPPPSPMSGSLGPDDIPMTEAPAQDEPAGLLDDDDEEEQEKEPDLAAFLHAVLDNKASDLHLTTGLPPMLRINGELEKLKGYRRMDAKDLQQLIYSMLTQKQREIFEENLELDLSYPLPGKARFRVNVFQQRDSVGSVMRMIPFEIKTTEDLGLPPSVSEFSRLRRGMVLVTGITGSGKSTTLAALVDLINSSRSEHIITVEDPDRILAPPQEVRGEPARGRDRHPWIRERAEAFAPSGPRRDPRRRAQRPRDHPDSVDRGRDRSPRLRDACTRRMLRNP